MDVTMKHVLDALNPYEPDYDKAVKLGRGALLHIETIIKTSGPLLASKATYLASLIQDERSVEILKMAAQSKDPQIRVVAAAGASNLRLPTVDNVLDLLKNDQDPSVRKRASKSIQLRRGGDGP
jgi:HEAT repeat protein